MEELFWRGRPLTELSRAELIDAITWLSKRYAESLSPENGRANALGRVEMMKRGEVIRRG